MKYVLFGVFVIVAVVGWNTLRYEDTTPSTPASQAENIPDKAMRQDSNTNQRSFGAVDLPEADMRAAEEMEKTVPANSIADVSVDGSDSQADIEALMQSDAWGDREIDALVTAFDEEQQADVREALEAFGREGQ